MSSFFSGTDTATLKEEGIDRNHFVSLIVNNAGSYTAAITRKISYVETREITYSSFEGVEKHCSEEYVPLEEIEWFHLKIEFEHDQDLHLLEIEDRLQEVRERKKAEEKLKPTTPLTFNSYNPMNSNNIPTGLVNLPIKEPSLFDDEPIYKSPSIPSKEEEKSDDIFVSKKATGDLIETLLSQLLTGSVLTSAKSIKDINSWLGNMEAAFDKRFGKDDAHLLNFNYWATGFIEYLLWFSAEDNESDEDTTAHYLAKKLIDKLGNLPKTNKYIDEYISILLSYGC